MIDVNKVYNMDCIEGMELLEGNSIDSIVTDAPYEIGFMNKKWDKTGISYDVNVWRECLRILKPGAYLLAFGGTRTYHRIACAIEDAGFIIHPMIAWVFGTGFPKATNLSKQFDKQAGAERKRVRLRTDGRGKWERRISNHEKGSTGIGHADGSKQAYYETAPATSEAIIWDGWYYGLQSLKPAIEPICMAQKPIDGKRMTDNVNKWGVGAINVDECRIPMSKLDVETINNKASKNPTTNYSSKEDKIYGRYAIDKAMPANEIGRFPANIIFDEVAGEILDKQSGVSKSSGGSGERSRGALGKSVYGKYALNVKATNAGGLGDVGGASRFFYCAKASKRERGEGNTHPSVKPIDLIKYLVKLVTPPGGVSLDIFSGSGTHAVACRNLGFDFIGFEISKEYCDIAESRLCEPTQVRLQL